ncbi:MAG TPA: G1 family glutamic endopeptidase [Acidimicrobiales bacterium]|nr:G1 family glutamic endopeptidase [Acidimicrobiales bacterium]
MNLHRNAPEYSINWSGYAVPAKSGEAIGAVRGSWLVPQINGAPPGFSSSWIGIGGYETSDLIQVGTASSGYLERNYAWYEMLPEYAIPITSGCAGDNSCAVAQGDRMAASIDNVGGDTWVIMLANLGKGAVAKWHWAMTATYKSSRSSAEWIFEAPQIGVGPVGVQTIPANAPHAKFLGGDYAVNGITRPLARSDASRIIMVLDYLGVVRTGTPSLMAPDGHFQVCAYKRTCPNF